MPEQDFSETQKRVELVEKFGANSNSYFALYPGFKFRENLVYVENRNALVAAGEPLCEKEKVSESLAGFARLAAQAGKPAVLIPVGQTSLDGAKTAGFTWLQIGSEPIFLLDQYPRSGQTWHSAVPTAKTLHQKGAKVEKIEAASLTPELKAELDQVVQEWFGTRAMTALSFLNRVEPWTAAEGKRFFLLKFSQRIEAFLAAIPIPARKGWYFVDLMRRKDSETGSTELLILEAMKMLKEEGAKEVTLGVAPLSNLDKAEERDPQHAKVYRRLRWLYKHGNQFYKFDSLYQYKLKFQPTRIDPVFMLCSPGFSLSAFLGLARAFMPKGLVHAALSGLWRSIRSFEPADWVRERLHGRIVVRSAPPTFRRLLKRCRFSTCLLAAVTFAFLFQWVFGVPFWTNAYLRDLLLTALFAGGLEYFAGTGVAALCFLFGAASSLPWNWFYPPSSVLETPFFLPGIFACGGALSFFIRRGTALLLLLCAAAIASVVGQKTFLPLSEMLAALLGLGLVAFRFRN